MRTLPRVLMTTFASIAVVAAMGTVYASGGESAALLSQPSDAIQVRLAGSGAYQTSVDGGRTWSDRLPQARQILLRSRTFDPLTAVAAADQAPGALRAEASGGAYIVQLVAVPLDSQRKQLRRLGARVGAYLPDFAYVVRMSKATRAKVAALPYVRWVGAYHPGDKVEPEALAQPATAGAQPYVITLVERDAADERAVVNRLHSLGVTELVASESQRTVEALLTNAQLRTVAGLDEVLAIDRWSAPEADMNNARIETGANFVETAAGYRGQGVRGEVMDGGLRVTHQEFRARPPVLHNGNSTSIGHGTSTYGQIFASGVNATARSMLPQGQGIFALNNVRDRWAHTRQLVDPAGPFRAVFQSNSWGGALTTSYTATSAQMDDIVFDHDILICQSQSNDGTRLSRPQAWAMNVLSVGGVRHRDTLTRTDDAWAGGASGQRRDVFASRPHASTAKALLINSANQYPFVGTTADLTRVHQGWGTVSVRNLFTRAQAGSFRLPVLVNETDLLTVGQRRTYQVTVSGTQPLRATMVYTDPMGSPSAARARVNDLTLRVVAPNGTVFWGNNGLLAGNWSTSGGIRNRIDTVENVFVQRPAAGTWTIQVLADDSHRRRLRAGGQHGRVSAGAAVTGPKWTSQRRNQALVGYLGAPGC